MIKKRSFSGLTLIELIVVAALIVVIGVILISSFLSISRSNAKAELMKNIRQNGTNALLAMERIITNGRIISCDSSTIAVQRADGEEITFACLDDSIASNSASLINRDLIKIKAGSCQFVCEPVGDKQKVTISFTLENAQSSSRVEETVQQDFEKVIFVRNQ